jgi:hypothetical protein
MKSSRHNIVLGDMGEHLIQYQLSKLGYECAIIDGIGIDLQALPPSGDRTMGISCEARNTESEGKTNGGENKDLNTPNTKIKKIQDTCERWRLDPYMGFYIDKKDGRRVALLMSLNHYLKICPPRKSVSRLSLTDKALDSYKNDPKIIHWEWRTTSTDVRLLTKTKL